MNVEKRHTYVYTHAIICEKLLSIQNIKKIQCQHSHILQQHTTQNTERLHEETHYYYKIYTYVKHSLHKSGLYYTKDNMRKNRYP